MFVCFHAFFDIKREGALWRLCVCICYLIYGRLGFGHNLDFAYTCRLDESCVSGPRADVC